MNCGALTAAHRTLPFGSRVKVCHSGCVVVRINDRGPFVAGRHIDLTPLQLMRSAYVLPALSLQLCIFSAFSFCSVQVLDIIAYGLLGNSKHFSHLRLGA
jgi:Lytic transglycolase